MNWTAASDLGYLGVWYLSVRSIGAAKIFWARFWRTRLWMLTFVSRFTAAEASPFAGAAAAAAGAGESICCAKKKTGVLE
jgi:hypothetical protein